MFSPTVSESSLQAASFHPIQPVDTGLSLNALTNRANYSTALNADAADLSKVMGRESVPFNLDHAVIQPVSGLAKRSRRSASNQTVQEGGLTAVETAHTARRNSARQTVQFDALAPTGVGINRNRLATRQSEQRDWMRENIDDRSLRTSLATRSQDGLIDRLDMLHIFDRAADGNRIDHRELGDLRQIVNGMLSILMPDFVQNLASKVVNGDDANRNYQRMPLGNLTASSSVAHLNSLVGKWFLGTDRPETRDNLGNVHVYQPVNQVLFKDGISYQDIQQGAVGNCYLLASLGAVASVAPESIQNMFIDNGDGSYTVRFFRDGKADYVTVDNNLPTTATGEAVFADYSQELWVALAEKAYAQLNESDWIDDNSYIDIRTEDYATNAYLGIDQGIPSMSTQHITGFIPQSALMLSTAPQSVITAFQTHQPITFSAHAELAYSGKIVGGHAYTLVDYNSATQLFTVYNPWRMDNPLALVQDSNPQDGKVELTWTEIQENFLAWDFLA